MKKLLDDTNFVDDVKDDVYIDDVDEENEVALGGGSNTTSDGSYRCVMTEEHPEKDDIEDAANNKYIGAELIMNMSG